MSRLIWSPSALTDVRRAYQFLFEKNPIAAMQAVSAIRQSVKTLSRHPEIGRPVGVIEPEYRGSLKIQSSPKCKAQKKFCSAAYV